MVDDIMLKKDKNRKEEEKTQIPSNIISRQNWYP